MQARALDPVTGVPAIPAMTSQAERECYYRLAKDAEGAVIEFGSWLGASTAYIAAAVRDKGAEPAHTYDKFEAKKGHKRKVREFYEKQGAPEVPLVDAFEHFRANMGPLLEHVIVHRGQIEEARWDHEPIGLIVFDAPKRRPVISAVLTNFLDGIREGTMTAWQDFCHFPSYEIPASLYRLREHFEFVEAVVPGSTLVFRVTKPWKSGQVTREALGRWHPSEIAEAYEYWLPMVPAEKRPAFRCGHAMFLADTGHMTAACDVISDVFALGDRIVERKWEYLRKVRPDFVIRYRPLFDCFAAYQRKAA
jgi:hypothetical protein